MEAICRPAGGPTAWGQRWLSPFTGRASPLRLAGRSAARPSGTFRGRGCLKGVGRSPGTERCGGGAEGRISVCFGKLETGLSRGWHESRLTPSCITNHVEKAASAASRARELRPAEQGLPFSLRSEPPSANPRRAAPQHRSAAQPPAAAPRRPCQPARDARGGAAGPAGRGGAARCCFSPAGRRAALCPRGELRAASPTPAAAEQLPCPSGRQKRASRAAGGKGRWGPARSGEAGEEPRPPPAPDRAGLLKWRRPPAGSGRWGLSPALSGRGASSMPPRAVAGAASAPAPGVAEGGCPHLGGGGGDGAGAVRSGPAMGRWHCGLPLSGDGDGAGPPGEGRRR